MKAGLRKASVFTLVLCLTQMLVASTVEAAKPADKGGGGSTTTEPAAGPIPEFYRVDLDRVDRTAILHGINFISGDATAPVFPSEVTIGGKAISIDPSSPSILASVAATDFGTGEGSFIIPFDEILNALVGVIPGIRVLGGEKNFEIKVVTAGGAAMFSAYFPSDIKDVPADTGICPCTFDIYESGEAEPGTTVCSAAEGIPTDQYIEAGYGIIDEAGNPSAVIMGSHSSGSPELLYESNCYVRDISTIVDGVETPVYREGPIAIGNGDHALCVVDIQSIESACSP